MIPAGAREILDMRLAGNRPKQPVLVSLIGRLPPIDGPCVVAEPGARYDWRFLIGLETHVWLRDGINARRTFVDLATVGPSLLLVWDVDLEEGAFLHVDPSPEAEARIAAAIDAGDARRLALAFEQRFDGRSGADIWLSPWGPIMNRNYALDAAHLEAVWKR